MGLRRRRSRAEGAQAPASPAQERTRETFGLSEADFETLLFAMTTLFGERGVTVRADDQDRLVSETGAIFTPDNLVTSLHRTSRSQWDAIVERHVDTMVTAMRDGSSPAPTPEEFLTRIYPRIFLASDDLPFHPAYRIDLGEDLFVVAAEDLARTVETIGADDGLARYGGWEAVMPRALDNLRALATPQDITPYATLPATSPRIIRWRADDMFGAARYLIVDELLARAGQESGDLGLVFALPSRYDLFVLVPTPESIVADTLPAAIAQLAGSAVQAFDNQMGNLSRWVYHRAADGSISRISSARDGVLHLDLPDILIH